MNERNEIGGDLQDEYEAIQAAEYRELMEDMPEGALCLEELEDWYHEWLADQPPRGAKPNH